MTRASEIAGACTQLCPNPLSMSYCMLKTVSPAPPRHAIPHLSEFLPNRHLREIWKSEVWKNFALASSLNTVMEGETWDLS